MNLTPLEGRTLVAALRAELDPQAGALSRDREVLLAPPFLTIPAVSQALAGSSILLGAQNLHFETKGAFTGEVSAPMLQVFGVTHVIIGQSERRHIFKETDDLIAKRLAGVVANRMTSILCLGETLEPRGSLRHEGVLRVLRIRNGAPRRRRTGQHDDRISITIADLA